MGSACCSASKPGKEIHRKDVKRSNIYKLNDKQNNSHGEESPSFNSKVENDNSVEEGSPRIDMKIVIESVEKSNWASKLKGSPRTNKNKDDCTSIKSYLTESPRQKSSKQVIKQQKEIPK